MVATGRLTAAASEALWALLVSTGGAG